MSLQRASKFEPHQWLEQAIEENHIKYFDYSYFKRFNFLGAGAFGKVEKATYSFAGAEIPYALKTIFRLHDETIERKALVEFIKEVSVELSFHLSLSFVTLILITKIYTAYIVSHSWFSPKYFEILWSY